MKSTTKHRKFKNFFISKDLQRPIIIAHLAYILLAAVVLIGTVLSPFYTDMFEAGDLWAKRASANMFVILLDRLSIAGIFIMVISLFHFVILTHKFCGPLVNIGKTIARMSEKDFTRKINLRRGDFLKNEAKQVIWEWLHTEPLADEKYARRNRKIQAITKKLHYETNCSGADS